MSAGGVAGTWRSAAPEASRRTTRSAARSRVRSASRGETPRATTAQSALATPSTRAGSRASSRPSRRSAACVSLRRAVTASCVRTAAASREIASCRRAIAAPPMPMAEGAKRPVASGYDLGRPNRRLEAQVRLLDVGAGQQAVAASLEGDAAVLEHVSTMAELQRAEDVLLDEENGEPAHIDALEIVEDRPHHHRREPQARLVQHEQPGSRHESAANGAHLLLAAG